MQDNYTMWSKDCSSSWLMNIIFGFYFLSLIDSSFCMAPVFICILHSILLQRGCMLPFDDLLSAFDWGWGHFTLFYYLIHVHTAYFNCCIHTLILQINVMPLSKLEEPSKIIDLFIFLFLLIVSSTAPSSFLWHRVCSHYAIFHVQCSDNYY